MEMRCDVCGAESDVRTVIDFDRFEEEHRHTELWVRNDR